MTRGRGSAAPVAVLKLGGSVLTGPAAYRRAAEFVATRRRADPGTRLAVVVSAENGQTDALLQAAREIDPEPDAAALDLLWSTGELRSVALLVLSLHAIGIRAAAANVHQAGLVRLVPGGDPGSCAPAGGTRLRPLRLLSLLAEHEVVVAPGFLAQGAGDAVVSLGRGGSDLAAVLLAGGLGAATCELVKDVDGYYSTDPNVDANATHLPLLDFAQALRMARDGCEIVQREALEAARQLSLVLTIGSMTGVRRTRVALGPQ
jgi:aspartate kinase